MNTLTLDRALELARLCDGPRVSIFMPTLRFAPGSQEQDATRLKNLLRTAEDELAGRGVRPADVEQLLGPVHDLLHDRPFWLRSQEGLGLLAGPEGLSTFRAPAPFAESVTVGDRFHLRPLLALLGRERSFWLLAISQKSVRLYAGTDEGLAEVPVADMPESLADALRWDDYEKASLQFHSGTPGTGGRRPAVFHGTGETDTKDQLVRFFRAIDRGVHEHLRESDAPLVLAGVDYLLPIYREVNTYPHLADDGVPGNPDAAPAAALHAGALRVIEESAERERRRLVAAVVEAWGSPRTTPDPHAVVPAAAHGRVDTLLLTDEAHWWGAYDRETDAVSLHATPAGGDSDLLEQAALGTIGNGGSIVVLDAGSMPHGESAVALLRY